MIDVSSVPQPASIRPARTPHPALCPLCGLMADNAVVVRSELTATATYVDTEGHIFAVVWPEVAA